MNGAFRSGVATNAIGGFIAGVLVLAQSLLFTKLGGGRDHALVALALLATGTGGIVFFVIYTSLTR